jgi:hypothetical protein
VLEHARRIFNRLGPRGARAKSVTDILVVVPSDKYCVEPDPGGKFPNVFLYRFVGLTKSFHLAFDLLDVFRHRFEGGALPLDRIKQSLTISAETFRA